MDKIERLAPFFFSLLILRLIVRCAKTINSMPTDNLLEAKKAKNDEFYTQYADIQKEINA